jgi:alpha-tubulin suppressor-like RCC1 family protein/C1A family cysteine protease
LKKNRNNLILGILAPFFIFTLIGCVPEFSGPVEALDLAQTASTLPAAATSSEPKFPLGMIPLPADQYNSIPLAMLPAMGTLPATADLSPQMPPVGDQGNQGSCVAWAVGYALKTYQENAERNWGAAIPAHQFSPAYIYNQIKVGNCMSGSYITDALGILSRQGCGTLANMPYTDTGCDAVPPPPAVQEAVKYRISSWRRVNVQDPQEICTHLAGGFPVVIGMKVYTNFFSLNGDTIYRQISGVMEGYHALCVVGYDSSSGYFIVMNSWGRGWGNRGYFKITFALFRQLVTEGYVAQDIIENNYTLTIHQTGQGIVKSDQAQETYTAGTTLHLTSTPAAGWRFARWEGDLNGSANPADLIMNSDKTVTAIFEQDGNQSPTIENPTVPATLIRGKETLIIVSCTAQDPDGTVQSVTVNLSKIGGAAAQDLTKDDDNEWSWSGNITPAAEGIFPITLTATDDKSSTAVTTVNTNVEAPRTKPPILKEQTLTGRLTQGKQVTIALSCKAIGTDGIVQSVKADLRQVGGPAAKSLTRVSETQWEWLGNVTPLSGGNKTITFTATDNLGATATAVTIHTVDFIPMIYHPTVTGKIAPNSQEPITVSCSVVDPDGTVQNVYADLSQIGGSDSQQMVNSNATNWQWTGYLNPTNIGNAVVTLTATDDDGNLTSATINVTSDLLALTAGDNFTLALKGDGTVFAWGGNAHGQLGTGNNTETHTPVQVANLTNITALAAGALHALVVKDNGTVWTWGYNYGGQLGNGNNMDSNLPAQVSGLTGVKAATAGYYHSAALKKDGTVWTWGHNYYGQLGNNDNVGSRIPVQVKFLSDVNAMASGPYHNLAVKSDGTVVAWGCNDHGQLGDTSTENRKVPIQVFVNAQAVAAGASHSLILKNDGTVWACGSNDHGQLGNGTNFDNPAPVQVPNLTDVVAIAAGADHNLVLKTDGTVWAWGYNYYGQLGDGSNIDRPEPVQVQNLQNIKSIIAGKFYSLALDGSVWAWGNNDTGQLADGSTTLRLLPLHILWP